MALETCVRISCNNRAYYPAIYCSDECRSVDEHIERLGYKRKDQKPDFNIPEVQEQELRRALLGLPPEVIPRLRIIGTLLYVIGKDKDAAQFVRDLYAHCRKISEFPVSEIEEVRIAIEIAIALGRDFTVPKIQKFKHEYPPIAMRGYIHNRIIPEITGREP